MYFENSQRDFGNVWLLKGKRINAGDLLPYCKMDFWLPDVVFVFWGENQKTKTFMNVYELVQVPWRCTYFMDAVFELWRGEYGVHMHKVTPQSWCLRVCGAKGVRVHHGKSLSCSVSSRKNTFYRSCTLISFNFLFSCFLTWHMDFCFWAKSRKKLLWETTVTSCMILFTPDLKKKKQNVFLKSITNALFNSTLPFYFTRGV